MWKNRYVSTTIVSLFIALMALATLTPAAQAQRSETRLTASDGVDDDLEAVRILDGQASTRDFCSSDRRLLRRVAVLRADKADGDGVKRSVRSP